MYMVYSETFILANTFDTYRGFNLAPRCHSCTKTTLDFYCSIHLTSSWFIEPVWVLTDLANCHGYYILLFFLTYPVAISPWKNRSHTKRLPMGNSRLPMGKMSSVTATTINELALTTTIFYHPQDRLLKCLQKLNQTGIPGLRCFGTVFRRSYQYFSIALNLKNLKSPVIHYELKFVKMQFLVKPISLWHNKEGNLKPIKAEFYPRFRLKSRH